MVKSLKSFALIASAMAAPVAASAQQLEVGNAEQRLAAAQAAQARAAEIYAYDQAAWHGTDSFFAAMGTSDLQNIEQQFPGISGYVVVPAEREGQLETLFVAVRDDGMFSVARFVVEGSEVVSSEVYPLGDEKPLPPLARQLFEARSAAVEEAVQRQLGACTPAPFNTVILPPDNGQVIEAYLLSAQTQDGTYPLGGHYRMDIAPDGSTTGFHELLAGCQVVEWDPEDEDLEMNAFISTHSLDPQPNEAHLFVSHYVPFSMGVVTGDAIWLVIGGSVTDPVAIDPETGELP